MRINKIVAKTVFLFLGLITLQACAQENKTVVTDSISKVSHKDSLELKNYSVAYFGSGCFWCSEAVFQSVEGIVEVYSGYGGGKIQKPTYEQVCTGNSGHAEMLEILYDSTKVSYQTLLEVFFNSHDPSTLNRQGNDVGTQYRSVIFYKKESEGIAAKAYISDLLARKVFAKITTEVLPYSEFYKAEQYHQDYELNNPENPYIEAVSVPRLNSFKKKMPNVLKKTE